MTLCEKTGGNVQTLKRPVSLQVVPDAGEAVISYLGLPQNWEEVWKLEIGGSSLNYFAHR